MSNVGPMTLNHPKKLSQADIDAFRSNVKNKMNGFLSPKEVVVQKHQSSAENSSFVRNDFHSKNELILSKVDNEQYKIQVKKIDLLNECIRTDSVEKNEPSPIPRSDSNENQSENQDEVERPSEKNTVNAVKRDLFVSDNDDTSASSQAPEDYDFAIETTVKKLGKRRLAFEEFTRALKQGKTKEEVIKIAREGLESLKDHYIEINNAITDECVKHIESFDEHKIKIENMNEQRFKDKVKRMEFKHKARVEGLKIYYEDRINRVKLRQWCCVCQKTASFYCCYKTYYCNLICQGNDWLRHKDDCQQQTMDKNDPYLSLNPDNRDRDEEEDIIIEDKKDIMKNMSSISKTFESTVTPPENNLNIPNAVPVLPNKPASKSPGPTHISTLVSLRSDPTKDILPNSRPFSSFLGGKKLAFILPKPSL